MQTAGSKTKISPVLKILPFLTYLLEVLVIYPWFVWLGEIAKWSNPAPHMNLISYVLIGLYIAVIARLSEDRQWTLKRSRWAALSGAVILWLIFFRWSLGGGYALADAGWFRYLNGHILPAAIALLSGPLFIWRGVLATQQSMMLEDIYRRFIGGLIFIVILLIVWSLYGLQGSGLWSTVGIYGTSYFTGGLIILAAINLENLNRTLSLHNEAAAAFRRRWAALLFVLVLIILGLAVGVASIFPSDLTAWIIHAFNTAANWLLIIIGYVIIYPVFYVIVGLGYAFLWIASLINGGKKPVMPQINMSQKPQEQEQLQTGFNIPPAVLLGLKWALLAAVIGMAIFFIGRYLVRSWQNKSQESFEEENQSVWSWANFRADLSNFINWLFPWLRKRAVKVSRERDFASQSIEVEPEGELTIRQIYRSLLKYGQLIHIEREKAETPYEYSGRLKSNRPNMDEEVDLITDEYVKERYGDLPAARDKLPLLNRLWRSLREKMAGNST